MSVRPLPHEIEHFQSTMAHKGRLEKRAAPRILFLLRAAKLVVDACYEIPCVVRDASTLGLKIRIFNPLLPPSRSITLELNSGVKYCVKVIWQDSGFAGLSFVTPIDVETLLIDASDSHITREVRLHTRLHGMLKSRGEMGPIKINDLSQQGANISSERWLQIGEIVRVESNKFPMTYATVQWREHPHYGLLFQQTFRLEELAQIIEPWLLTKNTTLLRAGATLI